MSKIKPAVRWQVDNVKQALIKLREARRLLTYADAGVPCRRSLSSTIKSVEGALRHMWRRTTAVTQLKT